MSWWSSLLFVFLVWCLWAVAAAMQAAVQDARHPLPGGQRRGVSLTPVIPVFPLALWGGAQLMDLLVSPWGTTIIVSLHAGCAVILVASMVWAWWKLRSRPWEGS
jgi:hypothetical protein